MNKKIIVFLSFLLVLTLLFTGCKKDDNKQTTPATENPKTQTAEVLPEISFTEKSVTVKLGETYKINVNVKNAKATFEYEIEDETIISVADGVVKALKEGETNVKIKVTCDDEKKTTAEFTLKVVVEDDRAFTISYSSDVTGFSKDSDHVKPGNDFELGEGPAVTGFTFVGWSLTNSADAEKITKLENVNSDVTVYAFYEVSVYTITYELDGAEYEGPTQITHGEFIELDSPKKTGYMFIGWVLEQGSKKYIYEITGNKDVTLYAVFVPNEYRITYDLDGGTYDGPTKINHDEKIQLGTPTREGYDFVGWTLDRSSEDYITELVGSGNVMVFAHFDPKEYEVTFELDGGTYEGATTVLQDKLLYLETPVKEGYIFLGWSLEQGSTDYVTRIYGRGPVTIYANWMVEPNKYDITYDLDGGAWFFDYYTAAEIGELFMVDFNAFTGYSFVASQLDTDNLSAKKFGDMFIDQPYLAKWAWLLDAVCEAANGDESFKSDSADFSSDSVRGFYLANLNGFFTSTQHSDTWYGTVGADFSKADRSQAVLDKAPLKAGGEGPSKYTEGVGVESFPTPVKDGYNFIKFVDAAGMEVSSISTTQTGSLQLKAVWEAKPDEYNITYELDGGSYDGATKYNRGEILQLGTPTKEGFAFLGWTLEAGATNYITEIVVENDVTVFANWIDASTEYTITYELDGGTYDGATTVTHGTKLTLGEATKASHKFLGWALSATSTEYLKEVTVTSDLTLYAIFTLNEYTITYDLDGGDWDDAYYTPEELGEQFMADFNAFTGYHITAEALDTDHLSGNKFGDFFTVEENLNKWKWLLNALCDFGDNENLRPDVCDWSNGGIRGFYLANLNGFFTGTQHTDTWYESVGQDFSNPENSKYVCEKGLKKTLSGPATYLETVGVESFPTPVKEGFNFGGWVDAGGTIITSVSETQTGDLRLKATWIAK